MGTPGAYDCVPWGKVGGRRAQAAPTLAPNNGAGDVVVHESDEPMTINMTEHGCSIDGTITMKNSVWLLSVPLRTPAGFAPLSAVLCCISVGHTCGGCARSFCVWSGRGTGTRSQFISLWCRLLRSAATSLTLVCEGWTAVRTSCTCRRLKRTRYVFRISTLAHRRGIDSRRRRGASFLFSSGVAERRARTPIPRGNAGTTHPARLHGLCSAHFRAIRCRL